MSPRSRFFLLVVAITSVACASGQLVKPSDSVVKASVSSVRPFNPFGLPTSALLCHSLLRKPTWPQGFVIFEFEDGTLMVNDRLIDAAYDSLGTPRLLVITATEKVDGQPPIMHGFSTSFPDGKPATGFHLVNLPSGGGAPEPPREALLPTMIAESRTLSAYLWSHRCERGKA
jgi:hypothetical protein